MTLDTNLSMYLTDTFGYQINQAISIERATREK